jgi:NADPH-dependent glutamate synthase beta subunit-like oxidoreductase
MTRAEMDSFKVPLFFSRSETSTEANRTGNWCFVRPSYRDRTAPCSEACPCGTDIPRVETLAAKGLYAEALATILMENPLPGTCGRVCFHPCEKACNRGELDEAISINALERFLAERARGEAASGAAGIGRGKPTGRKVAIIGSGPAGLSAACFLARLGHDCEVFESADEAGGLLRWGIPEYRLPGPVLAREIKALEGLGVKIRCGERRDLSFPFKEKGYAAVIAACGQARAMGLGVPGGELAKDGLDFLRDARRDPRAAGVPGATGGAVAKVAVIGGGNSAIDVARTLVRLGMKPLIVYRRRREDMPAFAHEVERALAEGVELMELEAPLSLARDAKGIRLSLQKMKSGEPGPDGRRRVEAVQGATSDLVVSAVYAAIGAEAEEAWEAAMAAPGAMALGRSRLVTGPLPVAFTGDLTTEDKSVSDAIASGKEAALALDVLLREGAGAVEGRLAACRIGAGPSLSMEIYLGGARSKRDGKVVHAADLNAAYFPRAPRTVPHIARPAVAAGSFAEAEPGFDAAEALAEAGRCMSCATCNDCDNCRTFCPEVAVKVLDEGRDINADYCKGCGVCVEECPRGAMVMGAEETKR